MQRYNFNITYPICDLLFGTLYRAADTGHESYKPTRVITRS